jgi:hypothetical protein
MSRSWSTAGHDTSMEHQKCLEQVLPKEKIDRAKIEGGKFSTSEAEVKLR